MHLLLVGISHRTAPVELRERLDFQARGLDAALRALAARGSTREAVVLSTCNRAELYVGLRRRRRRTRPSSSAFISEFHGVERAALTAARLRAASISTRRAICSGSPPASTRWSSASRRSSARSRRRTRRPPTRRRPARCSTGCSTRRSRVGKRVRTETGLGSGAVSVSFAAVALARKIFGDLEGPERAGRRRRRDGQADRAAHEVAGRAARHDRQPHDGARGADGGSDRRRAARRRGTSSTRRSARATSSSPPPAPPRRFSPRRASRRSCGRGATGRCSSSTSRMPRDVEPAAGEIEQVFLYNIDDLQATVRENLRPARERGGARRGDRRRGGREVRRAGCGRAARSRRSSRCASGSRPSAAPSSSGSTSSCPRCRRRRARASTKSPA